jgi:hypothetical protein
LAEEIDRGKIGEAFEEFLLTMMMMKKKKMMMMNPW